MTKLSAQMPIQTNGKSAALSWDELKSRLTANMIRNEYVEILPNKRDLLALGLADAIDAHGGYYWVIIRLKEEGVLSPKFDPLRRSLVKQKGMPEGLMKTMRSKPEPTVRARRRSVLSKTEDSEADPGVKKGDPSTLNSKEECKRALEVLLGKNANPDLGQLQAIVRAAQKTPIEELGKDERRELRLAAALIRYARAQPKVWGELREEYAQAQIKSQERERRKQAAQDARESVRAAMERICPGGQPPDKEMPLIQIY